MPSQTWPEHTVIIPAVNAESGERRAFERHFTEWRHQHGMRCLKIPYTKAFNEVTSIADAAALHKNLSQRELGTFNVKLDAEVEDAQGNVYNKKTYEDLQRQGLL